MTEFAAAAGAEFLAKSAADLDPVAVSQVSAESADLAVPAEIVGLVMAAESAAQAEVGVHATALVGATILADVAEVAEAALLALVAADLSVEFASRWLPV